MPATSKVSGCRSDPCLQTPRHAGRTNASGIGMRATSTAMPFHQRAGAASQLPTTTVHRRSVLPPYTISAAANGSRSASGTSIPLEVPSET
jgi:hypothetical protein